MAEQRGPAAQTTFRGLSLTDGGERPATPGAGERSDEELGEVAAQLELEPCAGTRPFAARHAPQHGAVLEEPGRSPAGEILHRRGVHGPLGIAGNRAPLDPWRE